MKRLVHIRLPIFEVNDPMSCEDQQYMVDSVVQLKRDIEAQCDCLVIASPFEITCVNDEELVTQLDNLITVAISSDTIKESVCNMLESALSRFKGD